MSDFRVCLPTAELVRVVCQSTGVDNFDATRFPGTDDRSEPPLRSPDTEGPIWQLAPQRHGLRHLDPSGGSLAKEYILSLFTITIMVAMHGITQLGLRSWVASKAQVGFGVSYLTTYLAPSNRAATSGASANGLRTNSPPI